MAKRRHGKQAGTSRQAGVLQQSAKARRHAFVEAYITNGCNAAEAARTAGYSPHTARQRGSQLLKNAAIAQQIAARQKQLADAMETGTERVLRELRRVGFGDLRKLFAPDGSLLPISRWPDDVAATVSSVETMEIEGRAACIKKVRLWPKTQALEQLAKHLGLFERDNAQRRPRPLDGLSPDDLMALQNAIDFIARDNAKVGGGAAHPDAGGVCRTTH